MAGPPLLKGKKYHTKTRRCNCEFKMTLTNEGQKQAIGVRTDEWIISHCDPLEVHNHPVGKSRPCVTQDIFERPSYRKAEFTASESNRIRDLTELGITCNEISLLINQDRERKRNIATEDEPVYSVNAHVSFFFMGGGCVCFGFLECCASCETMGPTLSRSSIFIFQDVRNSGSFPRGREGRALDSYSLVIEFENIVRECQSATEHASFE